MNWSKYSEWKEFEDPKSLTVELTPEVKSARLAFAVTAVNDCGSSELAQTLGSGIPFFKLNDPRLAPEIREVPLREVLIYGYIPSSLPLRAALFKAVSLTNEICVVAERKPDEQAFIIALRPGICRVEFVDLSIPEAANIPLIKDYKITGLLVVEKIPKVDPRSNKVLDENISTFVRALEKTDKSLDQRIGKDSCCSGSQVSAIYQPVWAKLIRKGYSLVRWESHLGDGFKNSTRPFPTDALNITDLKRKVSYCLINLSEVGGPLYLDTAMKLFGTVNSVNFHEEALGQVLLTQSCASYFKSFP